MSYPSEKRLEHEIELIEKDEEMTEDEKSREIRELYRQFYNAIEEAEQEERENKYGN